MPDIGVIGLGRMGTAIAQRLQSQGKPVTSWTRSGRAAEGVRITLDLASAVAQSDILILSLYDDAAVADVLEQMLTLDVTGKLIIDTSTVLPTVLTDRHDRITTAGAKAVDAPISGGPELVAAGRCGIFIGGDDHAAGSAQKALTALSDRIFHVGPLGAGLVMKTVNNAMLQVYMQGLEELLPLAKRAGLPLETAITILSGGPAGVPMVRDRIPKVLGADKTVGFPISAILKDNRIFKNVLAAYDLQSPVLDMAGDHLDRAIADGRGDADPAQLIAAFYDRG
ncbi:NAD(P)-dependent oxidoreductase [Loktanella sp. Alg231-35]|uniref:NAD(P)-dependent oxidoreductase n=1 Tax=Loktanella sp. Alg231-35 TaxID=1922220 RepID=UPI00131F13F5|nr:NAD(P)-dependent oxidoreductase [Loktanella sp. Alg231-35]